MYNVPENSAGEKVAQEEQERPSPEGKCSEI
jgi:hypothetical protein